MSSIHLHPRVVFYREGAEWVAHCLEFDVLGEGPTREEALERLHEVLAIKVEDNSFRGNPVDLFTPADHEYFAMYEAGEEIAPVQLHVALRDLVIDDTHAREYRRVH